MFSSACRTACLLVFMHVEIATFRNSNISTCCGVSMVRNLLTVRPMAENTHSDIQMSQEHRDSTSTATGSTSHYLFWWRCTPTWAADTAVSSSPRVAPPPSSSSSVATSTVLQISLSFLCLLVQQTSF